MLDETPIIRMVPKIGKQKQKRELCYNAVEVLRPICQKNDSLTQLFLDKTSGVKRIS